MNNIKPDLIGYKNTAAIEGIKISELRKQIKEIEIKVATTIRIEHNIPLKNRVTKDNIRRMLIHTLETGKSGKDTIKYIAIQQIQSKQWIKDISSSSCKKLLSICLSELEDTEYLIGLMKKHGTYCKQEIISKKLTVALNKVRKQRMLCLKIEDLNKKIKDLELALRVKPTIEDWHSEAKRLKEEGLSIRKIADRVNKPKTTVSDYFSRIK